MPHVTLRTQQECEDFVRGLCFMAAGGGGEPRGGLELLLHQVGAGREVEWVDIDALADGAWTAVVARMGGRSGESDSNEELAALGCDKQKHDSLGLMVASVQALEAHLGSKVEALVPIEIGAGNVPRPVVAAMELGIPVLDGDYSGGRAIPELSQATPEISGVSICPLAFVTRWGDVMILKDTVSAAMADRIGRLLILASYGRIGLSCYPMQIRDVKEVLAGGTLSRALRVGQVIREAREKGGDPVAAAIKVIDGWLLFEGTIISTDIVDEQSYAFGVGSYTVRGLGTHEGHHFRIWYKNEYHVSWMDDRPFVTSPDPLIMVDLKTGEPATSYDFSVGDQVAVVGRRAHKVQRTDRGIEALGPRHFGFDFDYVPVEKRLKSLAL